MLVPPCTDTGHQHSSCSTVGLLREKQPSITPSYGHLTQEKRGRGCAFSLALCVGLPHLRGGIKKEEKRMEETGEGTGMLQGPAVTAIAMHIPPAANAIGLEEHL